MEKIQILKIIIRSAQNVGKVWIRRKKILLAPFGAIPGNFSMDPKNANNDMFSSFPWWANGPYSPGLGSCAGVIALVKDIARSEEALVRYRMTSEMKGLR